MLKVEILPLLQDQKLLQWNSVYKHLALIFGMLPSGSEICKLSCVEISRLPLLTTPLKKKMLNNTTML